MDTAGLRAERKKLEQLIRHARVQLAMGRLSPEGYRAFVKPIEDRRAELEVLLMRHELG
ncbi:MAG TPA: hypothetical protein VM889_03770 [Candidatus Thermoplasmatota archaeon]|nr:hypothetical protein [Candidatus Thermoplasmatota archaeon]